MAIERDMLLNDVMGRLGSATTLILFAILSHIMIPVGVAQQFPTGIGQPCDRTARDPDANG